MNLLQMSISSAVMIAAVIVIRTLLINRLPKKTFLALWGVVLVRLLVPFSWPSPLSLYSILNHLGEAGTIGGTAAINILPVFSAPNNVTAAAATPPAGFSPWIWIWGIGMALCVLYFVVAYARCRREFRNSWPLENEFTISWLSAHECRRPIAIRETSGISAPLTYGIFRPVILMPVKTDWTDRRTLQYVLTHEYVHIRRFDGAVKLLLTAALCVHWFNPLVWAMYLLANRDIELSCDETVIRTFGESIKSAYALVLIGMEETKSGIFPLCNNFSKNAIEERITAIMKIKKTSLAAIIVAALLIGMAAAVFATSAITAPEKTKEQFISSISYSDGKVLFSIPNGKEAWNILIAGRIEIKDFGGRSVHYLENNTWENGKSYSFEITNDADTKYTDLFLSAFMDNEEFEVDLMPYLPDDIKD